MSRSWKSLLPVLSEALDAGWKVEEISVERDTHVKVAGRDFDMSRSIGRSAGDLCASVFLNPTDRREPGLRGRLIIWHGPPGTGKTYAIRSLMMHWRARFDYLVINDPERLAKEPSYYYEVASESTETPERYYRHLERSHPGDVEGDISEDEMPRRKRRCLFILEDCADLVLQESRANHFDKIGKLLNMTDGLFGQGREDVFLVTFNEDVEDIDQAFLRPGRCIANIDFPKFRAAEAETWLEANGIASPGLDDDATLAELYERVHRGRSAELAKQGGGSGVKGFGAGRRG